MGHLLAVLGVAFDQAIKTNVADPLLNAMKFLIPAVVALAGLHKIAEHREAGVAVLLDILLKGVAAVAVITVVQNII
jgi:hypothetical protein